MNPYDVLNVPKDFTLEQLKDSYKRIALKVHPDKGGSEQLFLLVTKCFKKLLQEYHKRQADRQYHELKANFQKATEKEQTRPRGTRDTKFDLERFNQVFSENRLNDAMDKGYGDWVAKEEDHQPKIHKNKFKIESFNRTFEEQARIDKSNKYIVKYKEPEALITTKKIAFTELGQDDVDDFSGDNMTKKHLNYMDYKVAHTTTKIVDPGLLRNVKTYNNINELEAARSKISYNMDDTTREEFEHRQNMELSREKRRIQALQEQERMIQQQYDRVNRAFLGYAPDRPSYR